MPSVVAHAIDYGGVLAHNPTKLEVGPINTTGANFLFMTCTTANAAADVTPVSDSAGNAWIRVPDPGGPRTIYGTGESSIVFYYVTNPITSATHVFDMTFAGGGGSAYGVMAVSAWTGIDAVPLNGTRTWDATVGGVSDSFTLAPVPTYLPGIVFTIASLTWNQQPQTDGLPTISAGWTLLDSLAANQAPNSGHAGLMVSYKILSVASTESVTYTYDPYPQDGGAGMWGFSGTGDVIPQPAEPIGNALWLRRVPHGVNQGTRTFYQRFELWTDVGQATALSPTPTVELRVSNDGARTWSTAQSRSLGAAAETTTRQRWIPVGSGRDRVFEVSSANAAPAAIVDAFVDFTEGSS